MVIHVLRLVNMVNARFGQNGPICVEILKPMVNDVKQSENFMADPKLEFLPLDDIPNNSFILLRIDVAGPMEKYQAADNFLGELNRYQEIFRRKNLTLLIMTPKETIEILTEEEMNKAGWFRKCSM